MNPDHSGRGAPPPDAMTRPLEELFALIESRRGADPAESWTARLLQGGPALAARKLGEEALETVIAAIDGTADELAAESADLLYHLLVLWAARGLDPRQVFQLLEARRARSGIAERRARPGAQEGTGQ